MIAGAAITASLALAGTAQADMVNTDFDSFTDGTVNNQGGWTVGATYDQAVVPVADGKALRISNEVTDGSFSGMPYSTPVVNKAGENEANNVLVNEFKFTAPDSFVPGLAVSVSPTGFGGSRMSYVRLEDRADGVKVVFRDSTFIDQPIALLDRGEHTVKIETTFVKGDDNDVVRVFIDGNQAVRGASWENYYRFDEERNPAVTDRLMWRLNLTPTPEQITGLHGNGFLFDNVMSKSSHVNNPAPLNPPAPGPAGKDGTDGTDGTNGVNGTDGVNGTNGTTTIIRQGVVTGAKIHTLHIRKISGMKFINAKATMAGRKIKTIKGRTIKVDLRGKSVGTYQVRITAKYKAGGKTYKVRTIRSLSIIRK
jgi:hypothetical protein